MDRCGPRKLETQKGVSDRNKPRGPAMNFHTVAFLSERETVLEGAAKAKELATRIGKAVAR